MSFDKNLLLTGRYCHHPFRTITIDNNGGVYLCICQAWLPISMGNILDYENLNDIVNSDNAKEIQNSILDGSYRYCDDKSCSLIQANDLLDYKPSVNNFVNWINFALDSSCNLTCPSCRKEFIYTEEGSEHDYKIKLVNHIIKLIEQHNKKLKFSVSGDGDPFASLVYRYLLTNLNVINKDIEIEIVTNGILAKSYWPKMTGIHKNVVRFKFSFDAGSELVYDQVRRGGSWNKLINSVEYMVNWRKAYNPRMKITSNFVVQVSNYKDMIPYVELCDNLGVDEINFQKIDNWGTFSNFNEHAVWQKDHPNHDDFLSIIQHIGLNNKVNLTNLNGII